MKKAKICAEWKDDLQQQKADWEDQIQSNVENVQRQFNRLREFLDSKENEELQTLKNEKEQVIEELEESENELREQTELVGDLIFDVKHQLELSSLEMLQGANCVLRSFIISGLMDVQQYWVHMDLHAKNDADITINKEKRQIQYIGYNMSKLPVSETYNLGVLGYPALSSGKHYWEVDVSRRAAWLLGLNDGKCAQPQLHSKDEMNFIKRHQFYIKQNVMYQPKCGYWVIGMKNSSVYKAFDECSDTHNSSVLALYLPGRPSRVGVFLDREAGTLSFYDVSNCGALIYRFYNPAFPVEVYPYFNPMECSYPMTVCGPPS
ncbi:tripartite motif-containing protein 30A-like [Mus pahari]|uniref:tripartite motif-containing protein 30A-like n=1 Tax=Mus pahari TaxID=10093 RepID=UPI0011149282|nr:tripartite motif-containing protein 30A-like [Mus pahari]